MGCGGSKLDDLPLVIRCRERKELIKAASDHRYALAASHVTYFRSLKEVGEALRKFVDEELVIGGGSGVHSPPSSPVLTLPSDEGKKKNLSSSSSTSLSHICSHEDDNGNDSNSHLHFHSGSSSDSSISSDHHIHDEIPENPQNQQQFEQQEPGWQPESVPYYPYYYPQNAQQFQQGMGFGTTPGINYSSYYMKRSGTEIPSMVYEEPVPQSSNFYPGYPQHGGVGGGGGGGYFGFPPMGYSGSSPPQNRYYDNNDTVRDPYYYNNQPQMNPSRRPPSPPPPVPEVSGWDFLNPFDSIENAYPSFYPRTRYGIGSTSSSPDSVEVRRREGIPELEDEMQQESTKTAATKNKAKEKSEEQIFRAFPDSGVGTSRTVPGSSGEGTSRTVLSQNEENVKPVEENEIESIPETIIISESSREEEVARKKGVSFEVEVQSAHQDDGGSSIPSTSTILSTHVARDIEEVVNEIKDEFEIASGYGKEVAVMLEVGKMRYQSTTTLLKVISSRILSLVSPPMSRHSQQQSRRSRLSAARVLKMAKANYGECEDFKMKSGNLSLTLERLYTWEKKLYKEVKSITIELTQFPKKKSRFGEVIEHAHPPRLPKIEVTWYEELDPN